MSNLLLLLSVFLVLSVSVRYGFFQQMPNPNNLQRIAFSDNLQYALLYDQKTKAVTNYRAYDWSETSDPRLTQLPINPKSLEFCYDPQFDTSFVFGDANGVIYKGGVKQGGSAFLLLARIGVNIKRILPSPDSTKFAAIQEGGSKVYIGDLTIALSKVTILDYPNNVITGIRWRPGKSQLAIVGGNIDAKTSVTKLYDAQTRIQFDFTTLTNQILADVEFSSDSNKLYGLYASQKNDVLLPIFDLTTRSQTDFLSAFTATSLLEIRRQGNFLTAFNSDTVYIWDIFTEEFYGQYPSTFKTASLSVDGSDLVTNSNEGKINVLKLCNNLQHIYNSISDRCQPCQNPCLNCFKKADTCSSCIPKHFLDSKYACNPCIDYCQLCQDATSCDSCSLGYFFQQNQCFLCAQPLTGCLTCSSKDVCNQCDSQNNWRLNFAHKCTCALGFVQVDSTCQACPAHCDSCADTSTCKSCNTTDHWKSQPNEEGKCVCQQSFFETNDICQNCILGCVSCKDAQVCITCNSASFWELSDGKCVCPSTRIPEDGLCLSCSELITGCEKCSNRSICKQCIETYTLNSFTNQCEEIQGPNIIIIVVVIIAALAAVGVGGYFLWTIIKKRQSKKVETLIQSQGRQQEYQTVEK